MYMFNPIKIDTMNSLRKNWTVYKNSVSLVLKKECISAYIPRILINKILWKLNHWN